MRTNEVGLQTKVFFISPMIFLVALLFAVAVALHIAPVQAAPVDLQLTQKEKDWLAGHDVIRLGVDNAWPPFEYIDSQKHYQGMAADYMRLVEQRLGIRFEVEKEKPWHEVLSAVRNHELDAFSCVVQTPAREEFATFTKPYLSFPMVIITSDNAPYIDGLKRLDDQPVSVVRGYASHDLLIQNHPELQLQLVATVKEGLVAVSLGRSYAFVGNLAVVSRIMREEGITNLKISGETPYRFELGMAVRKDWPELVPILQKALDSISQAEHHRIYNRWINIKFEQQVDYRLVGGLAAGFLTILIVVGYWNRKLRAEIFLRQRIEESLNNSQESLTNAQRIAHIGSWDFDFKSRTRTWSDEIFRILELDPKDVKPNYDLFLTRVHPDDQERVNANYLISVDEKKNYEVHHRLMLPGGTIKYIHERARTQYDEEGNPLKFTGTIQDVTERVVRENELEQVSERLKLATHAAHLGIFDWDITTNQLLWDQPMFKLYGVKPENFNGAYEAWEQCVHPDDLQRAILELQQSVNGEKQYDTHYRILMPGGAVRYIKANGTVYRDDAGKPLRMVGVNYNISAAVEAQQQLQQLNAELESRIDERTQELEKSKRAAMSIMQDANESKKRVEKALSQLKHSQVEQLKLSRAIESSPVSVVITGADAIIEYVNPKYIEVTGYSAEEAIGQRPSILKSGVHRPNFYQEMWQILQSGQEWHGEICNKKKDGSIFWERASISPVRNEASVVTHYVAVKEDITEKKKAEQELHDALTQAEEANQAKSDFLANMSHEIRTPMNAIIGMSYLALQTELKPQQQDYLDNISTAAKSLLNIINEILDLSKIEAGKMSLEKTAFNLGEVVKNAVTLIAGNVADKEVELLVHQDEKIPAVLLGDPLRLSQVLNNLLSNAAKFTKEGEIELHFRLLSLDKDSLFLECSVTDTGIGMTPDQIENLFQKFSQADTSITRKYGGTGLGLTICRQLVELMDGEIWAESAPGKGAKFVFTLRLEHREDRRKEQPRLLPVALRNLKVLLVEGNHNLRISLEKQLKSLSFQIDSCPNGHDVDDAIKSANDSKAPYELFIVDYQQSKQDGLQIVESIRKDPELSQVPFIIMANVNDLPIVTDFSEGQSMISTLVKPVTPSDLFNTVVEAFGYEELRLEKRLNFSYKKMKELAMFQGASVLLVEDNKINQQIAEELLKATSITVTLADNGLEAVEAVKEQRFDLVLMDIQMPEMDGLTATREIRRWEEQNNAREESPKRLPIIAMTALAMAGDHDKSLAAGMDDHVCKPIVPEELYSSLFRWLGERKGVHPTATIAHKTKQLSSADTADTADSALTSAPVDIDFPTHVQGIDLDKGLTHLSGNKILYLKLMREFSLEYQNFSADLREELDNEDPVIARRLLHTLKGVAGNLGALELQNKIIELENAPLTKADTCVSLLDDVCAALRTVLKGIGALSEGQREIMPPSGDEEYSFEEIAPQFEQLKNLLTVSDMEAENIYREIKYALLAMHPGPSKQLDQAIESLDFKQALKALEVIEAAALVLSKKNGDR